MNLFEQAAALLDEDELLLEGKIMSKYQYSAKFFSLLDRSAKKILTLVSNANSEAQNLDVIRKQYSDLNREYTRDAYYKSVPLAVGIMQFLSNVMEEFETGDADWLYAAKWTPLYEWIYDNGDRLASNSKKPEIIRKLANDYLDKVARPALAKYQMPDAYTRRKNARASVQSLLSDPAFQELLKTRSEGRFDIIKSEKKRRPPIIVDNEKKLTLTFRNYEELEAILAAKDANELYAVVKNQFDSPAGLYHGITDDKIPEGIEFQYQNDAIIACDWSRKNSTMDKGLFRGTYYLTKSDDGEGTAVLFVHNGDSLRSKYDVGEEESRYVNEFANGNNILYIALNRNDKFNGIYTNKDVYFNVFEIVKHGQEQHYISRGTYLLDSIEDDRAKYTRYDTNIARTVGTGSVSESFLMRFAGWLLG